MAEVESYDTTVMRRWPEHWGFPCGSAPATQTFGPKSPRQCCGDSKLCGSTRGVFPVLDDARLGHRVLAVGAGLQRGGAVHGQLVEVGGELVVALSISSKVMTWPVWAAMRPMEVTRLASAPRLTSL